MWFTPLVIGLAVGVGITYLCTAADRTTTRRAARARTAERIRASITEYVNHMCRDVTRPGHPRWALREALPAMQRICDVHANTDTLTVPGLTGAAARAYRRVTDPDVDTYRIITGRVPAPAPTPAAAQDRAAAGSHNRG